MQRAPHRRSRHRRGLAAALMTGALAASVLGGTNATAKPVPEPGAASLALPSPPGSSNVKVLVYYASATDESPTVDAGIEAIESIGQTGPAAKRFKITATDDGSV